MFGVLPKNLLASISCLELSALLPASAILLPASAILLPASAVPVSVRLTSRGGGLTGANDGRQLFLSPLSRPV